RKTARARERISGKKIRERIAGIGAGETETPTRVGRIGGCEPVIAQVDPELEGVPSLDPVHIVDDLIHVRRIDQRLEGIPGDPLETGYRKLREAWKIQRSQLEPVNTRQGRMIGAQPLVDVGVVE